MNTPALDRLLMYDTREPNLQQQAFNAIAGHAQSTRAPSALELDLIREFQQAHVAVKADDSAGSARHTAYQAMREQPNPRPSAPLVLEHVTLIAKSWRGLCEVKELHPAL